MECRGVWTCTAYRFGQYQKPPCILVAFNSFAHPVFACWLSTMAIQVSWLASVNYYICIHSSPALTPLSLPFPHFPACFSQLTQSCYSLWTLIHVMLVLGFRRGYMPSMTHSLTFEDLATELDGELRSVSLHLLGPWTPPGSRDYLMDKVEVLASLEDEEREPHKTNKNLWYWAMVNCEDSVLVEWGYFFVLETVGLKRIS